MVGFWVRVDSIKSRSFDKIKGKSEGRPDDGSICKRRTLERGARATCLQTGELSGSVSDGGVRGLPSRAIRGDACAGIVSGLRTRAVHGVSRAGCVGWRDGPCANAEPRDALCPGCDCPAVHADRDHPIGSGRAIVRSALALSLAPAPTPHSRSSTPRWRCRRGGQMRPR